MTSAHRTLPARLAAALPDAVVACAFLVVWLSPFAFGERTVRNALLTMLIEFIVVHASGFLGAVALASERPRRQRLLALAGFGAFYALFIAAFVAIFDEIWPIWVFLWLLLGKLSYIVGRRDPRNDALVERQKLGWAMSVVFYVCGTFLTLFLPLPRLGMTTAAQADFGLTGGGVWVDEPHRVVAFGLLYFAAQAWWKWREPRART